MEILSVTTNISRYGGAQKVMLDIHNGLKGEFDVKILSFQSLDVIHSKYGLNRNELIRFVNPWSLNNKILLVHARNLIPFFVSLKRLFFLNVRIIYVSHNVYNNYKKLTLFPKEVVSISKKVTENLENYFHVPTKNITLIYNGVEDFADSSIDFVYKKNGKIRILYPARINKVKRQIEIVQTLKRAGLSDNIEIHFAGVGEDLPELQKLCENTQFKTLGFIEDIHSLIIEYDYLMLFSLQEGLPLSLIEGTMHSKPILVNDVGGNLEIGVPGENGIYLGDSLTNLACQLNKLLNISTDDYQKMSQKSRNVYLNKFGYEQMIKNYIEVILKK